MAFNIDKIKTICEENNWQMNTKTSMYEERELTVVIPCAFGEPIELSAKANSFFACGNKLLPKVMDYINEAE